MTQVKPEEVTIRIDALTCPICQGLIEFELNESMNEVGLKFRCVNCKKKILITNYE